MDPLSPPSVSELKSEFIAATEAASKRVQSVATIEWIIRFCRMKDNPLSAIVAGLILVVFVWCIGWLVNRATCSPISSREAKGLVTGSLLAGLSYWIIKFLHDVTLKTNRENIAALPADNTGLTAIHGWFESRFSMKSQTICSLGTASLGVITVKFLLEGLDEAVSSPGMYITIFAGMFAVGNGIYCCLKCPTLTKPIVRHPIKLYPFDPANTISVQALVALFGKLSLGCGFMVTIIMLLMTFAQPWQSQSKLVPALVWLVLGWVAVTYCFIYPYVLLSKAIRQEKRRQMLRLECLIQDINNQINLETVSKEEFENLKRLIDLRDSMAKTKNTAMDTGAFRNYISSLILPLTSFFVANRALFGKLFRL